MALTRESRQRLLLEGLAVLRVSWNVAVELGGVPSQRRPIRHSWQRDPDEENGLDLGEHAAEDHGIDADQSRRLLDTHAFDEPGDEHGAEGRPLDG
jgi:hypothetical protein